MTRDLHNSLALVNMGEFGHGVFVVKNTHTPLFMSYTGHQIFAHKDILMRTIKKFSYSWGFFNSNEKLTGSVDATQLRNFASYFQWGPTKKFLQQYHFTNESVKNEVETASVIHFTITVEGLPMPVELYRVDLTKGNNDPGKQLLVSYDYELWGNEKQTPALFNKKGQPLDKNSYVSPC